MAKRQLTEAQLRHNREVAATGGRTLCEKYGRQYMKELGRKGYAAFIRKYKVVPTLQSTFAIVERDTNKIIAILNHHDQER